GDRDDQLAFHRVGHDFGDSKTQCAPAHIRSPDWRLCFRAGDLMVKELYRYIWKVSARDQVLLSLLAIGVFLMEMVPLELQRRIVNGAVKGREFEFIGLLCLAYVAVVAVQGGL